MTHQICLVDPMTGLKQWSEAATLEGAMFITSGIYDRHITITCNHVVVLEIFPMDENTDPTELDEIIRQALGKQ